eukprot:2845940-Rhodomonas_salina.2
MSHALLVTSPIDASGDILSSEYREGSYCASPDWAEGPNLFLENTEENKNDEDEPLVTTSMSEIEIRLYNGSISKIKFDGKVKQSLRVSTKSSEVEECKKNKLYNGVWNAVAESTSRDPVERYTIDPSLLKEILDSIGNEKTKKRNDKEAWRLLACRLMDNLAMYHKKVNNDHFRYNFTRNASRVLARDSMRCEPGNLRWFYRTWFTMSTA